MSGETFNNFRSDGVGPVVFLTTLSIFVAGFFIAVTSNATAAAKDREIENEEYGIKAKIPDNLPVCIAKTWTHPHGFGTVLVGKDCDGPDDGPAFNIWADYNVLFERNALESLKAHPYCSGKDPVWAEGDWSNAIGGLRTAMCRTDHANGTIDIVLEAQAGKWTDDSNREVPYINYAVNFGTTNARYNADVKILNSFLKSIEINKAIVQYRDK